MKKRLDKVREKVYTLQHGKNVLLRLRLREVQVVLLALQKKVSSIFTIFDKPTASRPSKEIDMKMSSEFLASPGGRLTQRVSLGICILAAAALVACGGGGSTTEAPQKQLVVDTTPTPDTVKTILSVKVQFVAVNGVNIDGSTVEPAAKVLVTYDAGGTQGTGTLSTHCGTQSLAGTQETATTSKLTFGHSDWTEGSCTGSVTVSAAGYASATQTFAFTVKKAAVVYHYSDFMPVVYADGTLGRIVPDGASYKVVALVNKTGYTTGAAFPIGQCGVVQVGDAVYKQEDGQPIVSCTTIVAGNTRRYFVVNPETGEIGKEVTQPSGVVVHDVGYGDYNATPFVAYGVVEKGTYVETKAGVFYQTFNDHAHLMFAPLGDFSKAVVVGNDGYKFLSVVSN